jgi:hypothetical protein
VNIWVAAGALNVGHALESACAVASRDDHASAKLGKADGGVFADAARAASDEDGFVSQVRVHGCSLWDVTVRVGRDWI